LPGRDGNRQDQTGLNSPSPNFMLRSIDILISFHNKGKRDSVILHDLFGYVGNTKEFPQGLFEDSCPGLSSDKGANTCRIHPPHTAKETG
jgi:hypothetical protein